MRRLHETVGADRTHRRGGDSAQLAHRGRTHEPTAHDLELTAGESAEVADVQEGAPGETPVGRYAFQRGGPGGRISGGRMLLRFVSSASGICSDGYW